MHPVVRRGALPVLIAVVAGILAAVPAWSAPPTWDAHPEDISTITGLSDLKARVAMAPDGSATAVWLRVDGGQPYVQSSTRPAGGVWSAPVQISPMAPRRTTPR